MKQVFLFILLVMQSTLHAQEDTIMESNKSYKIELQKTSGSTVNGFIKNMTDSVLYYATTSSKLGSAISPSDPFIPYSEIRSVRFKKTGAVTLGAAIGAGVGGLVGFLVGSVITESPKDNLWYSPELDSYFNGLAGGLVGALGGAAIGALVGVLSGRKFDVMSKKANFLELRTFLAKRSGKLAVNY